MKLKKSVSWLVLFFAMMPLCIFGMFSVYEMNQKIDYMVEENLRVISENQIAYIQHFTSERKNEMEKVANYELTRDAIKYSLKEVETFEERAYLVNLLKKQKKYGTYVASVSILDKEFHVVASSEEYVLNEISALKNVDPKFHTGDFIIGNVYERQMDDGLKKVVPAYIGVYDNDRLIGYVSEELDLAYFDKLRLDMDSLSAGTFYLLDGEYAIITAGNISEKGGLKEFVTDSSERSDYQKKWAAIDFEKNPSGEIRYRYGKNEYITYYSNVENTEWSIRVSENLTAQKRDMKSYSLLVVLIFSFLTLGVTFTQLFMTRRILTPIQNSIEIFDKIRETKDYSLRMPVTTGNEMGKLAESINELLAYMEAEDVYEKSVQRNLRKQAQSDPLTGVKNKKAIENYIMEMVQLSGQQKVQITLGFLDVDDFRNFNTVYGHQQGDEILKYVAETIQKNLHGEVGRVGGDEFIFCYVGTQEKEEIQTGAKRTLEELQNGYINPKNQQQIPITCSMGIVTVNKENLEYTELIRAADQAMYQAKNEGKNTFVLSENLCDG